MSNNFLNYVLKVVELSKSFPFALFEASLENKYARIALTIWIEGDLLESLICVLDLRNDVVVPRGSRLDLVEELAAYVLELCDLARDPSLHAVLARLDSLLELGKQLLDQLVLVVYRFLHVFKVVIHLDAHIVPGRGMLHLQNLQVLFP